MVSYSQNWYFELVNRVFVVTSVLFRCYYAFFLPIREYCSSVLGSTAGCHPQFLEPQIYSVTRQSLHRSEILVVVLSVLCCWTRHVCCTRLIIRTRIIVYSASFHLFLTEIDIPKLVHWSLKYQGVERPNLQCVSACPGSYVE